jgi:hypothetical protein
MTISSLFNNILNITEHMEGIKQQERSYSSSDDNESV